MTAATVSGNSTTTSTTSTGSVGCIFKTITRATDKISLTRMQLFTDTFPKVAKTTDANWIWTPTSSMVNELRFGFNNGTQFATGNDPGIPNGQGGLCTSTGCGGKDYPLNTGVTGLAGMPVINMGGFFGGARGELLGARNGRPITFGPSPFYDAQDSCLVFAGQTRLQVRLRIRAHPVW